MTYLKSAALCIPVLICTGCLDLGIEKNASAEANRTTFTPEVKIAAPLSLSEARIGSTKLRSFRIVPPYDVRSFIRMRKDGQCVADYYASWIDAPAPLFEAQFENSLRESGLFEMIADSRSQIRTQYSIDAVLTVCRIDERLSQPAAVTELRIVLSDNNSPRNAKAPVVLSATSVETLRNLSPVELAAGINKSLTKTIETIIGKLAKSLPDKAE